MLGDMIYEATGRITGSRVLDTKGPKIEVAITENGTLKGGIETTDIVTYWSIPRSGDVYYAEGKGVFMVKEDTNEVATWKGQGIAKYSANGNRRDIGSVFCKTYSLDGKLGFLNNLVDVFEYETDKNGNCRGKIWEWK